MSTVAVPIDVLAGRPDVTNTPETVYIAGTNFPVDGIAFPSGGSKALYLKIGAELYGNSGNWTLDLAWYSRSGSTSGNVQWVAALAAITPGDAQSVETKAFATSQNVTTTVNSTGKGETPASITITNLDSVNAGDTVWIKITRGSDTMTGDAILIRGSVSYSDGNSGTAGSGDVVGPASATANAAARYNSTTGKLLKNSPVIIDDSGNISGAGTLAASGTVTAPTFAGSATGLLETGGPTPLAMDVINDERALFRSGSVIFGKQLGTFVVQGTDFTVSSTSLVDITDLVLDMNSSTTYFFDFNLLVAQSTSSSLNGFGVNYSGTVASIAYTVMMGNTGGAAGNFLGATANNTALTQTTAQTSGTTTAVRISGVIKTTTSGTLTARAKRATATTLVKANSSGICFEQ
jgi:hypothetical protein